MLDNIITEYSSSGHSGHDGRVMQLSTLEVPARDMKTHLQWN